MTVGTAALSIVPMALEDIPGVVVIEACSFPTPWSTAAFRHELLENPYASLFVARTPIASGVIGFACLWVVNLELKINNIAVHPEWRRRGVGRRLLRFVLEHGAARGCREVRLEVRPSNGPARSLYTHAGFRTIGRRHLYYRDTREDAIVMARRIDAVEAP